MVTRVVVAALAAGAACQGNGGAGTGSGSSTATPAPAIDARRAGGFGSNATAIGSDDLAPTGSSTGSDDVQPPRPKPDEPDAPDPGKAIAELGAIPAWQAVVDRTHYLLRRGQHGVAYGVIGGVVMVPAPAGSGSGAGSASAGSGSNAPLVASPYVWLVDDSDGDGALAIRALLGSHADAAKSGARVALGGAWTIDADHLWVWKVDAISSLPATATLAPAIEGAPGHAIVAVERLPAGAHTISVAKEGELAYFQLVGAPPAVDGEGWPVADELGNPVYALLELPGERATYGAQDMRAPDERWSLRRGVTYVARLGKIRKRGPDKPASIRATSAPIRLK